MKDEVSQPHRSTSVFTSGFALGRDRFAQISAIEGIVLTHEMRAIFDRFVRDGLSAEERCRVILRQFMPGLKE